MATTAVDDPPMNAGLDPNSKTVWFRFVAPSSGGVHVNTSGSDYDTVLAAFTGSRGSLVWVASNDDANASAQSEIAFNVQSGITYYIEAAEFGFGGAGGDLHLSATLGATISATAVPTAIPTYAPGPTYTPRPTSTPTGPAPSNDDFNSAVEISSLPFSSTLNSSGATSSSDDPSMGGSSGQNANTVWYRYTASQAGALRVHTLGSSYDTVLAVFTGARGNLALLTSNDDAGADVQSEVRFNVISGQIYYIEVAQYGFSGGGDLRLTVESTSGVVASPTPVGTALTGTAVPAVLGFAAPSIPASPRLAGPVQRDSRHFSATGYRVNLEPFWDFFSKRGGLRTFGYPVSWEFSLYGFTVQMFQRGILQLKPDGSVATMNLLDQGLMPYTRINSSVFPAFEREVLDSAPSSRDPEYGLKVIAYLEDNVPNAWNGLQVNFLDTFMNTVRYEDAFPSGGGDPGLVPLLNLELYGLPTSRPAYDPNNHNFVYQRFQRGILHYDVATGATQGLLLADYLKSIMTGQDLPADLEAQAGESSFYLQYDLTKPGSLARPADLVGTNLAGAFENGG